MALMEVNFFSKALMRPVTMNVILPVDKVFFGEETEEENKPFKTLYLLHGVMGNYTDWVTGTCIKRWAEEKNLGLHDDVRPFRYPLLPLPTYVR